MPAPAYRVSFGFGLGFGLSLSRSIGSVFGLGFGGGGLGGFGVDIVLLPQKDSTIMAQLTPQQDLVMQQKALHLQAVLQSSDHLDNKGMALLQAGGLIVALSTVVSISGFVSTNPSQFLLLGVGIAFVAFLAMIILSIRAWLPNKIEMPGTRDWNELFEDYLYKDLDQCFEQVLADTIESITLLNEINQRKGQRIRWSAYLLVTQLGGLLIASVLVSI